MLAEVVLAGGTNAFATVDIIFLDTVPKHFAFQMLEDPEYFSNGIESFLKVQTMGNSS
jgi:hypothetical protein